MSDHDKAKALLNDQLGVGAKLAHQAMCIDPIAKRIYDSAIEVLARSIRPAREDAEGRP